MPSLIDHLRIFLLLILAPLPYWLLGLGILGIFRDTHARLTLAPLIGCVAWGWLGELAFITGLSSKWAIVFALLAALGSLWNLKNNLEALLPVLIKHYLLYSITVTLLAVNPFPAFGHWSTDWFEYLKMIPSLPLHQVATDINNYTFFFPACSTPLQLGVQGLVSLQLFSAVVSTSALLTFDYASSALSRPILPISYVLLVLFSPFYLSQSVTVWPKFLEGACLFVAHVEALRYRRTNGSKHIIGAWLWFGISLASSYTSLIFLPTLLICRGLPRKSRTQTLAKELLIGLVMILLTAGPFEVWAIVLQGLKSRAAHHLTVYYRFISDPVRLASDALCNFIGTFTSAFWNWGAEFRGGRLFTSSHRTVLGVAYKSLSGWVTFTANTFIGTYFLIICVAPRKLLHFIHRTNKQLFMALVTAAVIIVLVYSALVPYASPWTKTQEGLVGLCLALFYVMGTALACNGERKRLTRALIFTLAIGTLPFLAIQVFVYLALHVPTSLSTVAFRILVMNDANARAYYISHSVSLSEWTVPTGLLALLLMYGLIYRFLCQKGKTESLFPAR